MLPALALSLALSWVQVSSDTFVVKSSVGEERAKRVLRDLESFHQLLGATFQFRKVELPELPIEVLIPGDENQRNELLPEYNGKKLKLAGFYQRGQDRDFIVLSPNASGNQTRVVYHELTHYFLSRALESRPTWLSEGLAEYFATAEIDGEAAYIGGLSEERLATLKTERLLPLKALMAVDDRSPYYNETDKVNVFYAEAWAFVHFLSHGIYQKDFARYLEALAHGDAKFSSYIKVDSAALDNEFHAYLNLTIRSTVRQKVKISPEGWTMRVQPISAQEVELAIVEILLSSGKLDNARQHLEKVAGLDDEFPRASYYRGVLARLTGGGDPKEFFIDALMDLNLGPRAAVNLVQLHELSPPAVRTSLERAAASGTHMADVYWALEEIYLDDAHHLEEMVHLAATAANSAPKVLPPTLESREPQPILKEYSRGETGHFTYMLSSATGIGPAPRKVVPPDFPEELLSQREGGTVELDLQLTDAGDVSGVWLISAIPEIFSGLATAVIGDWKFDPTPVKIRVVFQFIP